MVATLFAHGVQLDNGMTSPWWMSESIALKYYDNWQVLVLWLYDTIHGTLA